MPIQQLITEVYEQVKDFREDESVLDPMMSENMIQRWITQFAVSDREFLLEELKNVLKARYFSKQDVKIFLKEVIDKLTEDFKYNSPKELLEHSVFLNLQDDGKSQGQMLTLMATTIREVYDFDIANCGVAERKNFIYIDDVLCTGNTLFQNIKSWCAKMHDDARTNLEVVKEGSINFICAYVFIHSKNYYKKIAQIKHNIDEAFSKNFKMYRLREIENHDNLSSAYDLIFPLESCISKAGKDYKGKVIEDVDAYTKENGYKISKEEFCRPADRPFKEQLFTSAANRTRFETILLEKGIEILGKANAQKENIRPLGFSLKSMKDFGFGALCFTWRNIANNTPLVFWYAGGGFTPLFTKR